MWARRKARRAAQAAQLDYEQRLAAWQAARTEAAEALEAARELEPATTSAELILRAGEAIFLEVGGAALVDDRQGPGQWSGQSAGLSVPLADLGGSPIRLNTGGTRGTYTPGVPVPTVVDVGTVWITNQRVVFQGGRQVRECLFAKLIGVQCDDTLMTIAYAVSNRNTPTVVSAAYDPVTGPPALRLMRSRTELALAHFRGDVAGLIARLQGELDAIDAQRPALPVPPA